MLAQGELRGLRRGGVQGEGDVHGHPWSDEDVQHQLQPGVGQFGPIGDGFAQEFRKVVRYSRKVPDGLVQRRISSFVKITQNLVGGNLASRTEVSNSKAGKRKLAEPADNTVDYKRMKVNLVNSDT